MCFKRHKMGIKLDIISILLHPSQFVYNVILNNFVFTNFLIFCLYMEKLNFFVGYLGALTIYLYRLALPRWLDKILSYLRCCNTNLETAILNLNILDDKYIHQAPLVSTQLVVALTINGQGSQLPQADATIRI